MDISEYCQVFQNTIHYWKCICVAYFYSNQYYEKENEKERYLLPLSMDKI